MDWQQSHEMLVRLARSRQSKGVHDALLHLVETCRTPSGATGVSLALGYV